MFVYQRVPQIAETQKPLIRLWLVNKNSHIDWLVVTQPAWKIMEFVNGKDDIPYMKWKINNVWNHQPVDHGHTPCLAG